MAPEGEPNARSKSSSNSKPKKRKYLPHGRPVKKKGAYPLRAGVRGFLITCDGGRERQAAQEALILLENFWEDIVGGEGLNSKCKKIPPKPLNKKIKFEDSDASNSDGDSHDNSQALLNVSEDDEEVDHSLKKQRTDADDDSHVNGQDSPKAIKNDEVVDHSLKKQETDAEDGAVKCETGHKVEEKSVDQLIEDELQELGDRNKRHFVSLESGCNGVIFIQMHKRAGEPSPSKIAEQILSLAASRKKHMSRFILRILPVEVSCYASEEEITKEIKPLISEIFPSDSHLSQKFAVLYDARANTGVDRMKIINAVAKSVPQPHKVDLKNPDLSIMVQIVKTICLVGVVKRYKELGKIQLEAANFPTVLG